MRWRQIWNEEEGKSEFVPIDEAARKKSGHYVQGDIQSFISPVDRTVISDRKGLREHNTRNGVVNFAEMEGVKPKDNKPTKDQVLERKRALYERVLEAEKSNGW